MSNFTDEVFVPEESANNDGNDSTSSLSNDSDRDLFSNALLLRNPTRTLIPVHSWGSRTATHNEFKHFGFSSVIKYSHSTSDEKKAEFPSSERTRKCLLTAHGSAWLIKGSRGSVVSTPCPCWVFVCLPRLMHVRYLADCRWELDPEVNRWDRLASASKINQSKLIPPTSSRDGESLVAIKFERGVEWH